MGKRDRNGNVALHFASTPEVVQVLLENQPTAKQCLNELGEKPFATMTRRCVPYGTTKLLLGNLPPGLDETHAAMFFSEVKDHYQNCVEGHDINLFWKSIPAETKTVLDQYWN